MIFGLFEQKRDEIQFFLAFFMFIRQNAPPLMMSRNSLRRFLPNP